MSDPNQLAEICKGVYTLNVISSLPGWLPQIIGAILAIGGGYFAVIARLQLEKRQEINYIKISLVDELTEIVSIIDKMSETQNQTSIIPPTYFNDLDDNSEAFQRNRPRLFIIGNPKLRKAICNFYKKLGILIKESRETVGTLTEADTTGITGNVTAKFAAIRGAAVGLENEINGYKFKPFLVF